MRVSLVPVLLLLAAVAARSQDAGPLRFEVHLATGASSRQVSGRLLVFMTDAKGDVTTINNGFGGMLGVDKTYTAAQEVNGLAPGRSVMFDPDILAFPAPLSSAPAGSWQAIALLDVDHSLARSEQGPGDITSEVVRLPEVDLAHAGTVTLTLSRVSPARSRASMSGVHQVSFTSPLLSRYWGRPIEMRATIVLPLGPGKSYPAVYRVPGFGSDDSDGWAAAPALQAGMQIGTIPRMAHVFLDPETALGHVEYANSVNNGPWASALTREFIPFLERRFHLVASAKARFLTGHSSGGWSTLWLQVNYPEFFNGTWSTGPDPVDFRSFCGADLASGHPENVYRKADGSLRNIVRMAGHDVMSYRDFAQYEAVTGEYGGQMSSFEAVFSPRGADGRPMPLFDRGTGVVDLSVARAWRAYDIHRVLQAGGAALIKKLRGKVRITVGGEDNFHLEEAVTLLNDYLKSKHSDAVVEIVPGRDHMNLYFGGLEDRILQWMGKRWTDSRKQRVRS